MKKPILERADIYAAMADDTTGKILSEDANIYAAMIEDEDEEKDATVAAKKVSVPFGGHKSVPVAFGEKTIDAASLAYVQQLERIIQKQKLELQKLDRTVKTLSYMIKNQRDHANSSTRTLQDIKRELDNKIDRRD